MRTISRFILNSLLYVPAFFLFACNPRQQQAAKTNRPASLIRLPDPQPVSAAEKERIRTGCQLWYDSILGARGFNGQVLVARYGTIVFEKYAGTLHIPGTDSITDSTSLHIASVSKTFTAMAVLKLVEEGHCRLDDEFSKYFPRFNYPGVTIRSLLNHRSGLPNYTHFLDNMGWDKNRPISNEELLDFLVGQKDSLADIAPPNTRFAYCNTNYALLALLIEQVSGLRYPEYLQRNFFEPLGMKHTFVYQPADSNRVAPSYNWKGKLEPLNYMDRVYGDKNIYTTVRDLLTWDRALSSNLLFGAETIREAYTPYSNERPGIKNYGLGWRMLNYPDGKRIIYHNGWWHGSNASFIRLVNDSATIIVIGNKFTRAVYNARVLAELFGNYFGTGEEEESEQNNQATAPGSDSLMKKPPSSAVPVTTKKRRG